MNRDRQREGRILYWLVRNAIMVFSRVWWRARFHGTDNIPAAGAYVLAPVHRSFIDFGFAACVTDRRMGFMGKASLWKNRWFGRIISRMGAYPVRRGVPDRDSLRQTLEFLESGLPVVLFPEGTRRTGPRIEDLHDGAAYVACRAGVPIVPMGIGGSERAMEKGRALPKLARVVVKVGEPIPPPEPGGGRRISRRAVHELTERLQAELQRLFDETEAESTGRA